jgi:ubiquinone biosynthesis protein UbiJ
MTHPFSQLPISPLIYALNHVLRQEDWARQRLVAHAGQTVCVALPFTQIVLEVSGAGYFSSPTQAPEKATVTLRVSTDALFKLAQAMLLDAEQQSQMLTRAVQIEGDVDFAQTLGYLAQHLRWDAEHDLARALHSLGPAFAPLASPLINWLKQSRQSVQDSAQRMQANVLEYFVHENPTLLAKDKLHNLTEQIQQLRERLDRLQKRTEKQEAKRG